VLAAFGALRAAAGPGGPAGLPEGALTPERAAEVRAHVVPPATERAWCDVGWRPTLWEAVVEANGSDRPILLWAMNGHPLACT
jgi:hypothetical protein